MYRFAHISDLHFSKRTWDPSQFFSKRWIGNLNLLLHRQNELDPLGVYHLIPYLIEKRVDAVFLTGDLTSTSSHGEFQLAKEFVKKMQEKGLTVFPIPGNHDHYTRSAFRNLRFYHYFDAQFSFSKGTIATEWNLKEHKISATYLGNTWWVVALDCAIATPILSSTGLFAHETERYLAEVLHSIPKDHHIILLNHFPLFKTDIGKKELKRYKALQKLLLRFPSVKLYLHGHTHRHAIADLRPSGLPIILDSGCTGHKTHATCHFIEIDAKRCAIEIWEKDLHWKPKKEVAFAW